MLPPDLTGGLRKGLINQEYNSGRLWPFKPVFVVLVSATCYGKDGFSII
jgi:hypothetical protein